MTQTMMEFPEHTTIRIVEIVLTKMPHTRDDDLALYHEVLKHLQGFERVNHWRVWELFEAVRSGVVPSPESVTRYRRLIQRGKVELRGRLWGERHKREEEVRQTIREYP